MNQFFSANFMGNKFEIFSIAHINGLLITLMAIVMMVIILKKMNSMRLINMTRQFIAYGLIIQEVSLSIWRIAIGHWQISTSLPLQLCGTGILLSAVMLIRKSRMMYEFLYFWAIAGGIQALLQPNLTQYGFPHYRYFQFFVSHGLFIAAVVFATIFMNFRPRGKSIYKAFVVTNVFALIVGFINFILGSNYMFLAHKPETASILDFLGPWPLYIIPLELIALGMFTLVYLPFLIKDYLPKIFQSRMEI